MHQFLRSIGFSQYTQERDIDKLLKSYEKEYMDTARRYVDDKEQMWIGINAPVSDHTGLCIVGFLGARGKYQRLGYFPYINTTDVSSTVKPSIYRRVDGTFFSAIIDDPRVGMTLIFQLVNPVDYLLKFGEGNQVASQGIKMAGFCTKGCVLLPGNKDNGSRSPKSGPAPSQGNEKAAADTADHITLEPMDGPGTPAGPLPGNPGGNNQDERMSLLEAAKNGQTEAIEQLAFEEMSTIAMLSKRLQNEDIYSIVNSVFMPQGVECDIYLVVGEILKVETVRNEKTGEQIYDLTLDVNDMIIHVAINEADLEGEPVVGRRFKGRIWLQGRIEY